MKTVSLKLTTPEAKAESPEVAESEGPAYPWGTCIYLDQVALEKLGMTAEDFKVGTTMEINGSIKVTGTSVREREGGESYTSVDLQVTDLGFGDEDGTPAKKTTGAKLYGDS